MIPAVDVPRLSSQRIPPDHDESDDAQEDAPMLWTRTILTTLSEVRDAVRRAAWSMSAHPVPILSRDARNPHVRRRVSDAHVPPVQGRSS